MMRVPVPSGNASPGRITVTRPIEDLLRAVQGIAKGNLSTRVASDRRKNEIGSLAAAFNHMAQSLEMSQAKNDAQRARLHELHRLGHEVDLQDPNNSLEIRLNVWRATLRMLRDHPIFGAGLSGFPTTVEPYRAAVGAQPLQYPHNILLNFWSETGILGVVAFGWLLVQAFRYTLLGWRRASRAWRPYHLGVAVALVAILVHGLVDVPYWKNDLSAEFWILLGLTWAGLRAEGLATR